MSPPEVRERYVPASSRWLVMPLEDVKTAHRISEFLLGPDSWDDQHHTPGEVDYFRTDPQGSLGSRDRFYWYVEDETQVIGIICARENEQRTRGYQMDYIAVHRDHRRAGIALALMNTMIDQVKELGGRYIITHTCDLPEYQGIQLVFRQFEFIAVGCIPDYYYTGEGRITYMKRL